MPYDWTWNVVPRALPALMKGLQLTLLVTVAAALCILLPLRRLAREGARAPGATRFGIYFACIGLGYLAIEMALLQKFGLFLGHPNYALSVVLAALLLTTGVGSAWRSPYWSSMATACSMPATPMG